MEFIAIKKSAHFLVGFVLMFAFYIQFHGEISPGGGFQSGIVFTIALIIYDACIILSTKEQDGVFYPKAKLGNRILSHKTTIACAAIGVLIYASTGLLSMTNGGNFLAHETIAIFGMSLGEPQHVRKIGLMLIETGVATTVFGAIGTIYLTLRDIFFSIKK